MVWFDLNLKKKRKQFQYSYFTRIAVVIAAVFVMIGCKHQKSTTNNSDSITIEEYACEGVCPVYTLTFFSNGSAKYNGIMNVIKEGEHVLEFSNEEINSLFDSVSKINFSELNNTYNSLIVDLPVTVIKYGEKRIEINDIRLAPESLKALISQLQALARRTNFIN